MRFLRCAVADWALLRARICRSALGAWLVVLVGGCWFASRLAGSWDAVTLALRVGMLAAIVCAAGLAGSSEDRNGLVLSLSHPTTPRAIVVGRWFAAWSGAVVALLLAAALDAWLGDHPGPSLPALVAGVAGSSAAAACALALVWMGGAPLALLFFLFLAVLGGAPPEDLLNLARPGPVRLAAAVGLELLPSVWRYRMIAGADLGASVHACAWTGIGLVTAGALIRGAGRGREAH